MQAPASTVPIPPPRRHSPNFSPISRSMTACAPRSTPPIALPKPNACRRCCGRRSLPASTKARARALARRLIEGLRARPATGLVQGLMREYALSSQEGVALMCLAEALLRIPDGATRDALIADKIGGGEWRAHLGQSPSPFVNAATWGLLDHRPAGRHLRRERSGFGADPADRPLRRADHPRRRRHRDAGDGRAIRLRPDDRGGDPHRPPARGARAFAIPTTCSAKRRRPPRTPRAISPPTRTRWTRSGRRRPGAAFTKGRACRSSFRRCIRAISARSAGG